MLISTGINFYVNIQATVIGFCLTQEHFTKQMDIFLCASTKAGLFRPQSNFNVFVKTVLLQLQIFKIFGDKVQDTVLDFTNTSG